MSAKQFGLCKVCGNLVSREPGKCYGDGQQDTDDRPVWLLECAADEEFAGRREGLEHAGIACPMITCGCND